MYFLNIYNRAQSVARDMVTVVVPTKRRRIMFSLKFRYYISMLLLCYCMETASAISQLDDSFESPTRQTREASALPESWNLEQFGYSDGYYAHGPDTYNQIPPKDGSQLFVTRRYGIWQNTGIKLQAGSNYKISVFAVSEFSRAAGFRMSFCVASDPQAASLCDQIAEANYAPPIFTSGWPETAYTLEYNCTAANAGKYLQVLLYTSANDTIWFDMLKGNFYSNLNISTKPKTILDQSWLGECGIQSSTYLYIQDTTDTACGDLVEDFLKGRFGIDLVRTTSDPGTSANAILLKRNSVSEPNVGQYSIAIDQNQIVITGHDNRAIWNGVGTLFRLLKDDRLQLENGIFKIPQVVIHDWPAATAMRGINLQMGMHDVDSTKRLIDVVFEQHLDTIVLEIGGYWLNGIRDPESISTAYTRDQIRELVIYAKARGMTVIPGMNLLGHTERAPNWYSKLDNGINMIDPRNYTLIDQLLKQIKFDFGSPQYFHAGMDECLGAVSANAIELGKTEKQTILDHIIDVNNICNKYGMKMIIWHDMLVNESEVTDGVTNGSAAPDGTAGARTIIPKGILINIWDYSIDGGLEVGQLFDAAGLTSIVSGWLPVGVTKCSTVALDNNRAMITTTWSDVCTDPNWDSYSLFSHEHYSRILSGACNWSWYRPGTTCGVYGSYFDQSLVSLITRWERQHKTVGNYQMIDISSVGAYGDAGDDAVEMVNSIYYNMPHIDNVVSLGGIPFKISTTDYAEMQSCFSGQFNASDYQKSANYKFHVIIPGIREFDVNDLDNTPLEDQRVIYTNLKRRTGGGIYGCEATVVNGKMYVLRDFDSGDSRVPRNGYVIGAHGNSRDLIWNIETGTPIIVQRRYSDHNEIAFVTNNRTPVQRGTISIAMNHTASKLIFLHTTPYAVVRGQKIGSYMIHYSDSSEVNVPVIFGKNIGAFNETTGLYDANTITNMWLAYSNYGHVDANSTLVESLYAFEWVNPSPSKTITQIRMVPNASTAETGWILLALTSDSLWYSGKEPGKASVHYPAVSATDANVGGNLFWANNRDTSSFDIYFGNTLNAVFNATTASAEYKGNQTAASKSVGPLTNGSTYYWRIDPENDGYTTKGSVWQFTTPAVTGQATTPNPANAATGVNIWPMFSWTVGFNSQSHDVYFGTTQTSVNNATRTSTEFKGNQDGTVFNLPINLVNGSFELPVRATRQQYALPDNWNLEQFGYSDGDYQHGPDTYSQIPAKDGTELVAIRRYGIWQNTGIQMQQGVKYNIQVYAACEANAQDSFGISLFSAGIPNATAKDKLLADCKFTPPVFTDGWLTAPFTLEYIAKAADAGKFIQVMFYSNPSQNKTIWLDAAGYPKLLANTNYYWRVDEIGNGGTTKGSVWSFTTAPSPGQASGPNPANSATGISIDPTLSWSAGSNAQSHDVYFGTSQSAINAASRVSAEFQCNQTDLSFKRPVALMDGSFEYPVLATRQPYALPDNWNLDQFGYSDGFYALGPDTYNQIVPKDGGQLFVVRRYGIWQNTGILMQQGVKYSVSIYAAAEYSIANSLGMSMYAATSANAVAYGTFLTDGIFSPPVYTSGWSDLPFTLEYVCTSEQAGKYLQVLLYSNPAVNNAVWVDAAGSPNLLPNTAYYWRIDEVGNGGTTEGTVWSFTTAPVPGTATSPTPATNATGVSMTPLLNWTAGSGTTSHDVYFGINETSVTNATRASAEFKINKADPNYLPGTLNLNTTYYWRIDEVGNGGTTKGTTWSFTTSNGPPTFVNSGAITSNAAAITPALPASISSGDILLLFVETANQGVTISNQNGGTWAQVTYQGTGTAGSTTATRLTVFWSRYNGNQGAPTTSDSGDHQIGRIVAVRQGVAAYGIPWNVTGGGVETTSDTSGSIPGATTTVANTLIVAADTGNLPDAIGTSNFASWTNANLTSLTERVDNTRDSGNGGAIGVVTGIKAAAGAYGNTTVTHASAAIKGMISIPIKP